MAREWLKKLRKDNNLTQVEMADMLGISQNHYCNIENGIKQKDLPLSMAEKIAIVFGTSMDSIVEFENQRG